MKRLSLKNSNTNVAEFLRIGMLSMHKNIFLAVGFLSFVGSVQAQGITLPEGTTGLTPLQDTVRTIQQVGVPVSPTVTAVENKPVCYMETTDGSTLNLSSMCGGNNQKNPQPRQSQPTEQLCTEILWSDVRGSRAQPLLTATPSELRVIC
jgi:hypothetical protein